MAHDNLNRSGRPRLVFERPLPTSTSPALPSSSLRRTGSWIDLSSQPSSASLSSATDEVVTHGLRVQHPPRTHTRRSRRLTVSRGNAAPHDATNNSRPLSAGDSSQEEYDESESESDRVMTSSNEGHPRTIVSESEDSAPSDVGEVRLMGDDEGENATALGVGTHEEGIFTPQPNAFSHPPSSLLRNQHTEPESYFPENHPTQSRTPFERHSFSNQAARPAQSADHEAALRASLTTLLSCAAAARSLPKPKLSDEAKTAPARVPQRNSARVDPTSLRILPASALNRRSASATSTPRSPTSSEKGKRKASRSTSSTRRSRSSERAAKRQRSVGIDEAGISPTLLTWVLSAGVLMLVSALSFSAGYSVGREDGRFESAREVGSRYGRQAAGRTGGGLRRRLLGAARVVTA